MLNMETVIRRVLEKNGEGKEVTHWKQDIANMMLDMIGVNPRLSKLSVRDQNQKTYIQFLSMIKKSGYEWGEMMGVLKTASSLPEKYSKGGFIINKLKEAIKFNKKNVQTISIQTGGTRDERRNRKRTSSYSSLPKEDTSSHPSLFG